MMAAYAGHIATIIVLLAMWWNFSGRLATMEVKINTLWHRAEKQIEKGESE